MRPLPMAFCPKCRGSIGPLDIVCAHCGYDFPPEPERPAQFSVRSLLILTAAAALALTSVRKFGLDGVGLSMIVMACGILALQQQWQLPPSAEIPRQVVRMGVVLLLFGFVVFQLGVRGLILSAIGLFAWLFFRRWD